MFELALGAAIVLTAAEVVNSVIDPASVAVPDISADQRKLGNANKFFVFHRTSTTFAEAEADLRFCMRYINQPTFPKPPAYVPWTETKTPAKDDRYYGIIGQAVIDGIGRSLRQSNMMRCMLPRGYTRYQISEGLWRELNYRDLESSIIVQAKIASGTVPPTPRLQP